MTNWVDCKTDEVITGYSLIKHLKYLCSQDEKYKNLEAIWTLDQEVYTKSLMAVHFNFPHYSLHEASHSMSIINKIEMLLGEDRIRGLSPTDTFMILESAYLHDFGMIVINNELSSEWGKQGFQRFLRSLTESSYDEEMAKAAEYILKIQNGKETDLGSKKNIRWPVEIKNYVTLIAAEYFRKKHSNRSAEWINDSGKLGVDFNFNNLIPNRIFNIIGKIAVSHGTSFDNVFDSLEYEANGIGTDRIHPRFISCLLRLGDLLDLDNNRFNPVFERMALFPETSNWHKDKHASITHFLVCPRKIEVSAICKNDKIYRATREWFDWLKNELKNLSSKWAEIVPPNFQGGPPSLGEIRLSIEGAEKITEQLDLRFSIDQKRAFEFIEGSGVYDSKLIFIREFIQNALDATKIQMWKDIKGGRFDELNIGRLNGVMLSENKFDFLDDFEKTIEDLKKFYPIKINISINKCEDQNEYLFVIEDRGCGISLNDLRRMENVGGSWKQDDKLADFIENMPFWLQPTGNFGMGLHSVFMVTEEIEIETKSQDDKAYKINFISRRKNGYITVKENEDWGNKTGTKITVRISESKIKDIFDDIEVETFYDDEFQRYDFFNSNYKDDSSLTYIAEYIDRFICNIRLSELKCYINGKDFNYLKTKDSVSRNLCNSINEKFPYIEKSEKKQRIYKLYFDNNGIFNITVKDSELGIVVNMKTLDNAENKDNAICLSNFNLFSSDEMFFKEIMTDSTLNRINRRMAHVTTFKYFNTTVDIFKGQAKEILDIARNNIKFPYINLYKNKIEEEIIPECMSIVIKYIKNNRQAIEELRTKLDKHYEESLLMLRLAFIDYIGKVGESRIYKESEELFANYGDEIILEGYKNKENKSIKFKELISANNIIQYENFEFEHNSGDVSFSRRSTYIPINYFIKSCFKLTEYILDNNGEKLKTVFGKLERGNKFQCIIDKTSIGYKKIIGELFDSLYIRTKILPISFLNMSPFDDIIVNKSPGSWYKHYDEYIIVSPFIGGKADFPKKDSKELIEWLRKEASFDNLVQWVMDNSIKQPNSKEKVEKAYEVLIEEYLVVLNEQEKNDNEDVSSANYEAAIDKENNEKK